jgi:hypothetical protein
MEPFGIGNLDYALRVHGYQLVAVLYYLEGKDGRQVPFDLVDQGLNIRVPYADLVIETCAEE